LPPDEAEWLARPSCRPYPRAKNETWVMKRAATGSGI